MFYKLKKTNTMTLVEMIIQNSKLDKNKKYFFGGKGFYVQWNDEFDNWVVVSLGFGKFSSRSFLECKNFILENYK